MTNLIFWKSVWVRLRVLEEIECLFVFNILLPHSSGKALRRQKSKKSSTGERVEYNGSLLKLNSPSVSYRSPILSIPRSISLILLIDLDGMQMNWLFHMT